MAYSQADFLGYTTGDILYASATDVLSKRAIGTSGQVLTVSGGVPTWATSGSGAFVQLQAWTVLGGSSATISIGSISGSYNDLLLVVALRTDRAASTADDFLVRFNSDTTSANYYSANVRISGTGAVVGSEFLGTRAGISLAFATASTATTGYRGLHYIRISDYASTARYKIVQSSGAVQVTNASGQNFTFSATGQWLNSSNAITQIDLLPVVGTNFVAGSAYALYAY